MYANEWTPRQLFSNKLVGCFSQGVIEDKELLQ